MRHQDELALEREIRRDIVKLGRLPVLRRIRLLQAAWRVLVLTELEKMNPMQIAALVQPPHTPPEAEVFFVADIHQTAEWAGHKAS